MKPLANRKPKAAQKTLPLSGLKECLSAHDSERIPRPVMTTWTEWGVVSSRRTDVNGVPIPKDLALFCEREAEGVAMYIEHVFGFDAQSWSADKDMSLQLSFEHVRVLRQEIAWAMESGFLLALQRYADDLKSVPEAAAIRAALERGRKKGADTVRQKAAPKKMAVRKRFRELRKSGFTKTDARRLIEQETRISFRQIERDTAGLS